MTTLGLRSNQDRRIARAKRGFRLIRSEAEMAQLAAEIAALPTVTWKGRTLYTVRCHAEYGKGPHDQNIPEEMLWALISLQGWRCPFHA